MNKIIILIFILMLFPLASAVEFDMKSNFSQGETLMAKLSGNFLKQPFKETIKFYRGHVRVPIEPNVAKINDEFYIYAKLPENEANYSIVIEDVKYYKGSQISEDDLVKNFSITDNIADFSVKPGFVITNDDFFIEVQNLQDYKLDIQIRTETILPSNESSGGFFAFLFGENTSDNQEEETLVTLKSGEIKKINFKTENIDQTTLKTIELSTDNLKYEIPVYVFVDELPQEHKDRDFKFDVSELNFSISTNSNITKIIYLFNTGEENLENISLIISDSLKPYVSVSIENIDELKEDKQIKIELYFESGDEESSVEGQIKAKESSGDEDIYTYLAVFLNIMEDYIPLDDEEDEEITTTKTCSEMNGVICGHDQKCESEEVDAKDDKCCLTECYEIGSDTLGKIIGWLIIIGIIVFLIWFFKFKYRKAK